MSSHDKVLVPLESWVYHSPEVRLGGKTIDIGLFAEALIYYDQVIVNPTNEPQFAEFIGWFLRQGRFADLISLIKDGSLVIYYYSFASNPVRLVERNEWDIMNIDDEESKRVNIFERRVLEHKSLRSITHTRHRERLRAVLTGRVIEVKAAEFGAEILNARQDYLDPQRSSMLMQALVDELYPSIIPEPAPRVSTTVTTLASGRQQVTWSVNFDSISRKLPDQLALTIGIPLAAACVSGRLLWSAAKQNVDLYLGSPLSILVGNKLEESSNRLLKKSTKIEHIIDQLEVEVEFPNIRQLVNSGEVSLEQVLELRRRADKFRRWLRHEGDRDRNAIIAYHNEVAKEAGWTRGSRKMLRMFGALSGPLVAAGTSGVAGTEAGVAAGLAAAGAGEGLKYIFELVAKQNADWKPVVFGKWAKEYLGRDPGF